MDIKAVKGRIAEVHRGKKWILAGDVAAGFTPVVDQLREWDVAGVMVVAGVEGVGDLPNADSTFLTGPQSLPLAATHHSLGPQRHM